MTSCPLVAVNKMAPMINRRICLIGSLACASIVQVPGKELTLRYLEALPFDLFGRYAIAVLGEALGRTPQRYRLQLVPNFRITQGRVEVEVARSGGSLDIMWSMTSREREQRLLPIRVPLDRGLHGWRVAIIRRADLTKWREPTTLSRLKSLRAGQGLQWPDVEILRANGLEVSTASSTGNLFEMLRKGHIDYFPRSVLEVIDELKAFESTELLIEPGMALHYPTANYVFLSPALAALADPLKNALDVMVTDGTLERIFQKNFAAVLAKINLSRRRIVELNNPSLPDDTPIDNRAYWWHPRRHAPECAYTASDAQSAAEDLSLKQCAR